MDRSLESEVYPDIFLQGSLTRYFSRDHSLETSFRQLDYRSLSLEMRHPVRRRAAHRYDGDGSLNISVARYHSLVVAL